MVSKLVSRHFIKDFKIAGLLGLNISTFLVYCIVLFTQKEVAVQFTKGSGMILRVGVWNKNLKRQQIDASNPFLQQLQDKDKIMKFDCEKLSCFAEEKETLFFGGKTVLRIKGIIEWSQGQWMRYDKYLEAINVFSRMMDGFSVKEQPIVNRKRDQKVMKRVIRDVLRSLMLRLEEAESPEYVHNLMLYHMSAASRITLLYDELLADYKWLDCILKDENTETLHIADIALLFSHSESITFLMADKYDLSDVECLTLMNDLMLMTKMGLEMIVHFEWPSDVPKVTKINLRRNMLDTEVLGAGARYRSRKQSVSFVLKEGHTALEEQQQFISRTEHLIGALSRVEIQKELTPELVIAETPETVDVPKKIAMRISKNDIDLSFQRKIATFCNKIVLDVNSLFSKPVPEDVEHLILFFYAKPMEMNVMKAGSDSFETALICPIRGDWKYITKLLFPNDPHNIYDLHQLTDGSETKTISCRNWRSFRWNEVEDMFKVKGNLMTALRAQRNLEVSLQGLNSSEDPQLVCSQIMEHVKAQGPDPMASNDNPFKHL